MNKLNQLNQIEIDYHIKQWESTYRSTDHFYKFIKGNLESSKKIVDLGCGTGGCTYYISTKHNKCKYIGIDNSKKYIDIGLDILELKKSNNLDFIVDDWFNLNQYSNVDGVISLQTLSWLPEFENPLKEIFNKIKPQWISLSSLFYEGEITIKSTVYQRKNFQHSKSYYNTYSIPLLDQYCREYGYKIENYKPFEIDIDIKKPKDKNIMGTYTVKTVENNRLQISGPLLMNWYFIKIVKI
jgi:ubiquinone/menaquinone biosynthesis C-methylase UbiE